MLSKPILSGKRTRDIKPLGRTEPYRAARGKSLLGVMH